MSPWDWFFLIALGWYESFYWGTAILQGTTRPHWRLSRHAFALTVGPILPLITGAKRITVVRGPSVLAFLEGNALWDAFAQIPWFETTWRVVVTIYLIMVMPLVPFMAEVFFRLKAYYEAQLDAFRLICEGVARGSRGVLACTS